MDTRFALGTKSRTRGLAVCMLYLQEFWLAHGEVRIHFHSFSVIFRVFAKIIVSLNSRVAHTLVVDEIRQDLHF